MPVKLSVGQKIQLKKNHACGGNTFTVMRAGMDFRLQCDTCKAQIWLSRPDVEKRLKKVLEPQEEQNQRRNNI
ncbi:MAG: DUF951 domain-containing protein [Firmicutes bacterium]|nr:DUF951 domain-containing protein [Bacillota bacterium]